ncbi:penicillin acylase family protein, partial [Candidatus Sumerlaeota bacterium]|nr:penicillin acylase family protein [Candidatus Sumerlaeota bacterium]
MSHKVKWNHVLAALLLFSAVPAYLAVGEEVEIIRDNFGVPHIFAETDEAVFFGSGYAQAEDRLEELLRNYRRSVGTESEVFGESHYRDDYRQRMWRHAEISEANFKTIRPKMQRRLIAYTEGIKAFMEEHPEQVPGWAPEIHPWHVIALSRYIIWGWPEGDAGGDLGRGDIRPDPIAYRGSNQWVIAPDRTEIGAPIALIDPHLGWYGPFRFYELRLYGDELKVSGASILGVPFPALGHSQWCSVAMTTGSGDTADVFVETINPDDPLQYRVDGEWRDMEVRRERIGVRRSDGTVDQVEQEFHYTRHGPVVARKEGKAYVMALPYMESAGLIDQLWDMLTAKNLTEMKTALGQLELMGQNVMVATVDGDIYYQRTGKVPIRAEGVDSSRPIPGDSTDNDWQGIYKAEALVQVENPPQGYMQNCNVSPFAMMKESPMRLGDYPRSVYGAAESPAHQRAAMAVEILDRTAKMSIQGALELAMNTEVYGAENWQRRLQEVGAESKSELDV